MKLPNGFGSVYKMSGKRRKPFMARKTIGWDTNEETCTAKQKYQIIGYYETRKDALVALSDFNANPYDINASKVTFAEMFEKFTDQSGYEKLSHSSKNSYKAAYKRCEPIEGVKFVDLRKPHLQSCIDNITDAGWGTRKKVKVLFTQLYKLARESDVIEKDYSEFVTIGKNNEPSSKIPFTQEEINLIKKHLDEIEYLDTILILLYTGLRVNEMLALKTIDVDLDNETMKGGSKSYAGINRIIPIHPILLPHIKKYYNAENEYLITYIDGKKISYGNYRDTYWDKIMEVLNMKHLPHECRHTFVSMMDSAGVNPMIIKRIVGHAGNGITEKVYTHKDIIELKAGICLIK